MSAGYNVAIRSAGYFRRRDRSMRFWGGKCLACGSRRRIEAHHIGYHRLGHEGVLSMVPLSKDCHEIVTFLVRHGVGVLLGVLAWVVFHRTDYALFAAALGFVSRRRLSILPVTLLWIVARRLWWLWLAGGAWLYFRPDLLVAKAAGL
jgi:hypothetical protein